MSEYVAVTAAEAFNLSCLLPTLYWNVQAAFNASKAAAAPLKAFANAAAALAGVSIEDAQRVMVYTNAIIMDGRFSVEHSAEASLQELAITVLKHYHYDDTILDKVSSVLVALPSDSARILPTLLVIRKASARLQRNVLELLLRTVDAASEDTDTLEEARQYALFAIETHPSSVKVCGLACALLLNLNGTDQEQVCALLTAMHSQQSLNIVQLAGCTFIGKALSEWLTRPHEEAVLSAMAVHGQNRLVLLAALAALEACCALPCWGVGGQQEEDGKVCTCVDVLETASSVVQLHSTDRPLYSSALFVLEKVLARACPRVRVCGNYLEACRKVMDTHCDDVSTQCIGARIMHDALRERETPNLAVGKAHIHTLLRALVVYPYHTDLLNTALPAVCAYFVHPSAPAAEHALMATACSRTAEVWQDGKLILSSIMMVLCSGLRLCAKADADLYSEAVARVMAIAKNHVGGQASSFLIADMACRVAWEWGAMRERAAHEHFPLVLAAMRAHWHEPALMAHAIRAVKAIVGTVPLTVSLCDEVITRLGKAMLCLKDSCLILFSVQAITVMLARCPKVGKRLLASDAFKLIHKLARTRAEHRPPAHVIEACKVLVLDLVKRNPRIRPLLTC